MNTKMQSQNVVSESIYHLLLLVCVMQWVPKTVVVPFSLGLDDIEGADARGRNGEKKCQ